MSISVITPVYNRADLTQKFVSKLIPMLRSEDELVIVDNASGDNTLEILAQIRKVYKTDKLTIISNNRNYGFGTANNIGANISRGEILAFISNDVEILDNFIPGVEQYLAERSRTLLGARLLAYNTGWNNFDKTGIIPYLEGWAMFINRENHFYIGGFDTGIFIDYDDIDYSFRCHTGGLGLAQITLPLMHPRPGSSFTGDRLALTLQAQDYFCRKYGFTKLE